LHLRDSRDRGGARIEIVRESVDGHHPIRVQEQDPERRALFRPAEPNGTVLVNDLERPEDSELEHRVGR
jgi:hypothetical protein